MNWPVKNPISKDLITCSTAASAPYCNGVSFVDANVRDYFCNSMPVTTWQIAYTTYVGETDGRSFSPLTINTETSTKAPAAQSSADPNAGIGAAATTSTPPSSTTTAAVSGGGSSTPVAAIAGGAVGGVAFIALIVTAIFFVIRHNKKKVAASGSAVAPVTPYVPPQDPNQSAYAAAAEGKPAPTPYEQAFNGGWTPAPVENQYGPPPMQHGTYQPVEQQQYPPMAEMQGSTYHPQQTDLTPAAGYYTPGKQSAGQTYTSPTSPGQ